MPLDPSPAAAAALLFLLGLVLGSFYNVCISRYLSGESVIFPGSRCPHCRTSLKWWENIPLFSFALLKGRCRTCREPISWRYPAVELVSGLWMLALYTEYGLTLPLLIFTLFGGLLIVQSTIDLESFILPDIMTLPGGAAALICAPLFLGLSWVDSLVGAVAGAGFFLLLQKGYKLAKGVEGMGTGDIKLMFLLGALLGWQALPLVIFLAALAGLAISLIFMLGKESRGMQAAIPFGPFLSLGGMIYVLWGSQIWQWYLY